MHQYLCIALIRCVTIKVKCLISADDCASPAFVPPRVLPLPFADRNGDQQGVQTGSEAVAAFLPITVTQKQEQSRGREGHFKFCPLQRALWPRLIACRRNKTKLKRIHYGCIRFLQQSKFSVCNILSNLVACWTLMTAKKRRRFNEDRWVWPLARLHGWLKELLPPSSALPLTLQQRTSAVLQQHFTSALHRLAAAAAAPEACRAGEQAST